MATQYLDNIAKSESHPFGIATPTVVRKISLSDVCDALRRGWEDFKAVPSHTIILCVIYPVLGIVLFRLVLGYSVLPLLFPLAAGFALIGPFAGLGLYELSRRRDRGEEAAAWHAIYVLRAPSFGAMLELGIYLFVLFGVWIAAANAIYIGIFGNAPAASIPDFARRVSTTPEGWSLIIGCGVGFLFAPVTLCVSVVAFPLMLDRHTTAIDAIRTSVRVAMKNPLPIAVRGLIVAALLVIGSVSLFVGLAVVLPVLGHATWHLYRRAVEPDPNPAQERPRPPKERHRYAADFPANLFPWSRER